MYAQVQEDFQLPSVGRDLPSEPLRQQRSSYTYVSGYVKKKKLGCTAISTSTRRCKTPANFIKKDYDCIIEVGVGDVNFSGIRIPFNVRVRESITICSISKITTFFRANLEKSIRRLVIVDCRRYPQRVWEQNTIVRMIDGCSPVGQSFIKVIKVRAKRE